MRLGWMLAFPLLCWGQEIRLAPLISGLRNPVGLESPKDGSNRLFVVEQRGTIQVWDGTRVLPQPFLDIQTKTRMSGECGLLGLAFPPNFAAKQYFYVNYTDPACQLTTVSRIRVSGANANVADAATEQVILTQRQPYQNHNGGQLAFGPDGYLYIALGDGGSGGDPQNNAQNRMTWLGKILRIDVESDHAQYHVPASNPFVGDTQALPEIWAYGLRNPWRFSFDRETGDLWIGDVGQNRAEEIDSQPASSKGGENYGWGQVEGFQCFRQGCDTSGYVRPVWEYTRQNGDISVTGGFVYRGSRYASLSGTYIYGDYSSGRIWGLRSESGRWANRLLLDSDASIPSFGQDEQGELYVVDHNGRVLRIEALANGPVLSSGTPVVNAASYAPGLVAGSLAAVFGSGFSATGTFAATAIPLPTTIAGVRVTVNDVEVPLYAVVNGNGLEQVNFQVPWDLSGAAATVRVWRNGVGSGPVTVPVQAAQPGVFAMNGEAIVVRALQGTLASSVRAGEYVYIYATGLGAVENQPVSGRGSPTSPLARTRANVTVTVGDVPVEVQYAGLAPDLVGVYQINFRVPAGLAPGAKDLVVRADAVASPAVRVRVE